jgi:hypothetical protein
VIAGLVLLGALTLAAILLYRSAPATLAEARTESWLAARPNAVGANLARARERLDAASREAAMANDSLAAAFDSVAAEHAWRAASLASEATQRREALALWSEAMLHRAEMLRVRGTGAGFRADDDATLRRALDLVVRVDSISPFPAARARADSLRGEIERQLRVGPLEWLPR